VLGGVGEGGVQDEGDERPVHQHRQVGGGEPQSGGRAGVRFGWHPTSKGRGYPGGRDPKIRVELKRKEYEGIYKIFRPGAGSHKQRLAGFRILLTPPGSG